MSSVEIDSGIAAHKAWISRLRLYLDGISSDDISIAAAGDFTKCALGQWLYGPGQQYELFLQFHELVETHKNFHDVAAEIVHRHRAGDLEGASRLLDVDLVGLSDKIVKLLGLLKV